MEQYQKSGYLHSACRIFYLNESEAREFQYHYHDFHKILIFVGGDISYTVEGKEYELQPGDVMLIPAGQIHRPVIRGNVSYERVIAYVSREFFDAFQQEKTDLFYGFREVEKYGSNLIRLPKEAQGGLERVVEDLIASFDTQSLDTELYQKLKLVEYLLLLNRCLLKEEQEYHPAGTANIKVLGILEYIHQHLTEELSIDNIANAMYLDRSYMMHLFKKEMGYTIGHYITEKRLFLANEYILKGESMTDACYKSGFQNYTTFYQAYKKKYHCSPKKLQMRKSMK